MTKPRKTQYFVLCLLAGLCLLSSCIEEYEADISAEDSDLLVVEGTICSSKLNKFTLSRTQVVSADGPLRVVANALVSVRGTDGSETVAKAPGAADQSDGYAYYCDMGPLNPEVGYYLHIEADGEVYESEPQKPLRSEKIASVRGVQLTPESSIDVLVTPENPADPDQPVYYSWTYDETWQVFPDYRTGMYYDTELRQPVYQSNLFPFYGWVDATGATIMIGSSANYDDQHIQDFKLYNIGRADVRISSKYSGLIHQRAISKAEYEYELARRQAGSDMGGLFTPLPSALPTNIHCLTSGKRVIGFVGCSLNTGDYRFFLKADDFVTRHSVAADTRVWLEDPTDDEMVEMVERGMYLCAWEDPEMSLTGKLRTAWATIYQLDVRYRYPGAYIEEPDFWSLEENVSY